MHHVRGGYCGGERYKILLPQGAGQPQARLRPTDLMPTQAVCDPPLSPYAMISWYDTCIRMHMQVSYTQAFFMLLNLFWIKMYFKTGIFSGLQCV